MPKESHILAQVIFDEISYVEDVQPTRGEILDSCNKLANKILNMQNNSKFIFVAAPTKFKIRYQNSRGEVKDYLTVPIETFPDGFAGYVFGGQGVKRFKNDGIIEIEQSK
jgi:hypothetical protein